MSAGTVFLLIVVVTAASIFVARKAREEWRSFHNEKYVAAEWERQASDTPASSGNTRSMYQNFAVNHMMSARGELVSMVLSIVILTCLVAFDAWLTYNLIFNTNWGN